MTPKRTLAGAGLAILLASTAQAATFDFTFFDVTDRDRIEVPDRPTHGGDEVLALVEVEDRTMVGSGVMSYDGPVEDGLELIGDLGNLMLDFTIGDWSWDQDDIVSSGRPVFWSVADRGDFFTGSFGSPTAGDKEGDGTPARVAQAEPLCSLIGSVLLYNGEQCLTASPGFGFPDEFVVYAADSMIESIVPTVQSEPDLGEYEAIARVSDPVAAVPLPATLPLLALALGGMGYARGRRS